MYRILCNLEPSAGCVFKSSTLNLLYLEDLSNPETSLKQTFFFGPRDIRFIEVFSLYVVFGVLVCVCTVHVCLYLCVVGKGKV